MLHGNKHIYEGDGSILRTVARYLALLLVALGVADQGAVDAGVGIENQPPRFVRDRGHDLDPGGHATLPDLGADGRPLRLILQILEKRVAQLRWSLRIDFEVDAGFRAMMSHQSSSLFVPDTVGIFVQIHSNSVVAAAHRRLAEELSPGVLLPIGRPLGERGALYPLTPT